MKDSALNRDAGGPYPGIFFPQRRAVYDARRMIQRKYRRLRRLDYPMTASNAHLFPQHRLQCGIAQRHNHFGRDSGNFLLQASRAEGNFLLDGGRLDFRPDTLTR